MKLSRINKEWVKINFSDDFSWKKVNEVKKIPGREYKPETENWHVPLKTRENATKFLRFCNQFGVGELPDQIENMIMELRERFAEEEKEEKENRKLATGAEPIDLERVYGTAKRMRLRDYQKAGVEYIEKNERVLIGDEMGLGKSPMSIAAVHHLDAYPVLCVVPAAVRSHWENEWNTWIPRRAVKTVKSGKHSDFRGSVVICTYSLVHKFKDKFKEKEFEAIICDESHKLKNNKAKRSKAVRKIVKANGGIPYRLLLTGTPVVNQPSELINQLKILGVFKDTFGGWMEFTSRFCSRKEARFGKWDISGASNLDELHERLTGNCYIRRNKDDENILEELPDKQRTAVELEIDNRKEYNEVEENLADHLRDKYRKDPEFQKQIEHLSDPLQEAHKERHVEARVRRAMNAEHLVKINELRQKTSEGKMKEAKKWIRNFMDSGEPLLLFAHYKDTTEELANEFDCPKITGSVNPDRRGEIVEQFQNGDHDLLVLNIEAGGVGITLTEASNVAFVELPWRWADVEQAEDRSFRFGQEDSVNVYFLLAGDTIDVEMAKLIKEKKMITDAVNKGKDVKTTEQESVIANLLEKVVERQES